MNMNYHEEKDLRFHLKELGGLYQDYGKEEDEESRNFLTSEINSKVSEILDFVDNLIEICKNDVDYS